MSFSQYLKETKAEFKHINWPSRKQTITYTVVVIVISIFTAYYLGLFDLIFARGLEILIS